MSHKASSAVWDHSEATGTDRLVLLAIADQASDEGALTAYNRSQAWIARKIRVTSTETVRRSIRRLEELGELEVLAVGKGKQVNQYQLKLPGLAGNRPSDGPGRPHSPAGAEETSPPLASGGSPHSPEGADAKRTAYRVSRSFPLEPSAAGAAADPGKPTEVDPIKRHAHALAVLAMEQPVKPVLRGEGNPFAAVMALCERLIRAGTIVNDIEAAIVAGVEVWTLAGLQTAIAKARPRRHRNGLDSLLEEIGGGDE